MTNSWSDCTWGDIATLAYGKGIRGYENSKGKYRVYGTNGAIGWHDTALCQHATVIIGRKGAYRGVHYSPDPCYLIDTAFFLSPKTDFNMLWAYYELLTHDINSMDSGSAIPSTSRDSFYRLPVRLPPRKIQDQIADILGSLDSKIDLNHRMSETLEATVRTIFHSWFIDSDQLDKWSSVNLGSIVDIIKGRSYKSEELAPSDTALVTLKSINRGGGYRTDGLKPFVGTFKSEQVVNPGELVVAFTDVTQAAEVIGKPAIVFADSRFSTLVASLDLSIVRPKAPLSVPFLYCLFRTDNFQDYVYGHTNGTTVLHLSKDALPSYCFAMPSADMISKFNALAEPIFEKIALNKSECVALVTIRDSLLPKLLSGVIPIKDKLPAIAV